MAEKVRVGVVGTSWFADGFHLPNLAGHPHAALAALCGRNRARAEEIAAKFAIPHVFTDYNAMIGSGLLDALVVIAPDDLHYPIVMAGLNAGQSTRLSTTAGRCSRSSTRRLPRMSRGAGSRLCERVGAAERAPCLGG